MKYEYLLQLQGQQGQMLGKEESGNWKMDTKAF